MTDNVLRNELQSIARDEGLTPAKLECTRLLALMIDIPGWSIDDATNALYKLIVEVVAGLRGEKARSAARATLNLADALVQGRSAMSRQAALAEKRRVHPDTVRGWWRSAVSLLADALPLRINELNQNSALWSLYRNTVITTGDEQNPGHSFDRIDFAWRFHGKRIAESVTSRWLLAHEDGVDHVRVHCSYSSDRNAGGIRIVPLLNCRLMSSVNIGPGILVSDLELPVTLRQGERVFFSYRHCVNSPHEAETRLHHFVGSAGVGIMSCRVQFDPSMLPARVWSFDCVSDVDCFVLPPEGSSRYLDVNRFGYLGHVFRNCRNGRKYGVSWRWPDGS